MDAIQEQCAVIKFFINDNSTNIMSCWKYFLE